MVRGRPSAAYFRLEANVAAPLVTDVDQLKLISDQGAIVRELGGAPANETKERSWLDCGTHSRRKEVDLTVSPDREIDSDAPDDGGGGRGFAGGSVDGRKRGRKPVDRRRRSAPTWK